MVVDAVKHAVNVTNLVNSKHLSVLLRNDAVHPLKVSNWGLEHDCLRYRRLDWTFAW